MMIGWYSGLTPDNQAFVQGLVVMVLVAVVRGVSSLAGKPLGDTALGKFKTYLTVAVATGLTSLVTSGEVSWTFALLWAKTLFAAVGGWESISRLFLKAKSDASDKPDLTAPKMSGDVLKYGCIFLLIAVLACGPVLADDAPWFDASRFSFAAVAAPNAGPVLGMAASYHTPLERVWLDLGGKREGGGTEAFLGASTDWPLIPEVLGLFGLDAPRFVQGLRYGGGKSLNLEFFDASGWFFYAARDLYNW